MFNILLMNLSEGPQKGSEISMSERNGTEVFIRIDDTDQGTTETKPPSSPPLSQFSAKPHCYSTVAAINFANTLKKRSASKKNDDGDEVYKKITLDLMSKENDKRLTTKTLVQWVVFGNLLGCLIASLTVETLQKVVLWSLELWQWCLLGMFIFSRMYVMNWIMHLIIFFIERKFLLRKKVLYFVHGLKHSVQSFIWLSLVLLTWVLLFRRREEGRSEHCRKVLHYVTWTLVSILIGSFLWFLKTLFIKILATKLHEKASKFRVKSFFDRMQESIVHQYFLQTLSGPVVIKGSGNLGRKQSLRQLSFKTTEKNGEAGKEKTVVDMSKIHKMKQEKVPAWTMNLLIDAVRNTGLSTISNEIDKSMKDDREAAEQDGEEITNEKQAKEAACRIFNNVSQHDREYIEKPDLERFLIPEELDVILPDLLEGVDKTGKIDVNALKNWVVKVYQERKELAHALTDMKTAVRQLNRVLIGVLVVITVVIWFILTEIASTKVLFIFSAQFLTLGFIFKNTCKSVFECIIFVFIIHPFDVGDRCVVDGVQLKVEEMNILSTVFSKLDFEMVYYPNSVLAKKPIGNYLRSPVMGDVVHFSIDFKTPSERIEELKERIKKYLGDNQQYWSSDEEKHGVVVNEIENLNLIKMSLYVNHTMNFQDFLEKNKRRTELVLGLKKIFEDLKIQYNLLPQLIHLVANDKDHTGAQGN